MVLEYELMLRLILATGLGALIGIERESARRAAGLRTHMMISLAACLITITSLYYFNFANADVSRIASGIVLGVGFIGAGTIINKKTDVKGLTTAASVWAVSGIGLSVGAGNYMLSIVAAVLVFIILQVGRIEKQVFRK